jgi:D-alanyl-lipoteichoic acid acyltransferase DltB (MBOAT superfamily)
MFGYTLPVNFNAPYRANCVREFWQRWHMTLSRFLRDYLFVPLARNKRLPHPRILAILLTMFLAGLWHGAAWTFAIWGLVHGIALLVNTVFTKIGWHLPPGMGWLLTILFWTEAAVLFRADSFTSATVLWTGMHDLSSMVAPMDWNQIVLVVVAGVIAILGPTSQVVCLERLVPKQTLAIAAGIVIAVVLVLIGDGDTQEFYYFQF